MSVLQNPVRAMKTLIAPTVTGLLAALVNRDSLETAQCVMVCLMLRAQPRNKITPL